MPDAAWIEFTPKTSAFDEVTQQTVAFHMNAYHRKIAYAARLRRALSNPRSRKFNLRIDRMWYARQVSRCWTASAAADLAAAKSVLRGKSIYAGMFEAKQPAGPSGGMDLDS